MTSIYYVYDFLPFLLKGASMTLKIAFVSALLSLLFGTILGVLSSNKLKVPYLSTFVEGLTFIFRSVPFYVQLLIFYFVLPDLLGYNLGAFSASCIALGLCSSGFLAQIIRGGVNNISHLQWESAFLLGYSRLQAFRYFIFPQAIRKVLPMINNELESLLKSTSITASIGMLELTRSGMNIVSREMKPVAIYLTVACFYVLFSALMNFIFRSFERRFICS